MAGSYGPPDSQLNSSSGNPADPSDPKPHITRSSGGAGMEGTYGPDSTVKGNKEGSQEGSAQQQEGQAPSAGPEQKPQAAAAAPAQDSAMPDPLVAADDGSHNMQPRSKL